MLNRFAFPTTGVGRVAVIAAVGLAVMAAGMPAWANESVSAQFKMWSKIGDYKCKRASSDAAICIDDSIRLAVTYVAIVAVQRRVSNAEALKLCRASGIQYADKTEKAEFEAHSGDGAIRCHYTKPYIR